MPNPSLQSNAFEHISLRARVLLQPGPDGEPCVSPGTRPAQIYLIRRGPVHVVGLRTLPTTIVDPSVLLVPGPAIRRLFVTGQSGSEMVCATVHFGGGECSPISESLPAVVLVELSALPGASSLLQLLFDELPASDHGRQAALDRLAELFMIRLLRYCLAHDLVRGGTLAGCADTRLAPVLTAIHRQPALPWTLAQMASIARMSRSRFALRFHEIIGTTPAEYLTTRRIATAQALLRARRPIKCVAGDVGYASTSAFIRAFTRKVRRSHGCARTPGKRSEARPLGAATSPALRMMYSGGSWTRRSGAA